MCVEAGLYEIRSHTVCLIQWCPTFKKYIQSIVDVITCDKLLGGATLTPRQRAQIGKYAADHGPTKAATHFSSLWKIPINESTARRLRSKYLDVLSEACEEASKNPKKAGEAVTVETLETKERKGP